MTTDQGDQDGEQDEQERELPEDPQGRPTEAVEALEDQHAGSDPDDGERVTGDDVTQNPDGDEMEGLPGPSPNQPGESSG